MAIVVDAHGVAVLSEVETLGDVAEVLEFLKGIGITRASVEYVLDRVFWEGQS
jgi:uncharacterized protein YjiS (DUF1127 family)